MADAISGGRLEFGIGVGNNPREYEMFGIDMAEARGRYEETIEVILGAFLTQNTAWRNVELALRNLRRARALSLKAIRNMPERKLAALGKDEAGSGTEGA